jgi:hypothetical protein
VSCILVAQASVGQLEPLEPTETLEPLNSAIVQQLTDEKKPLFKTRPNFAPGTRLFINATSLALRTGPKKDAGLIHYISKDEMVVALEDVIEPVPLTIGNREGQWLYVQHGQHKGYVFDGYLAEAPPSLADNMDWVCVPGKRVGPITNSTTLEDLTNQLGAVNIATARFPLGEGKFEQGTAVFPGDKNREVIIQWEIPEIKPKAVIVNGRQWKTEQGIGIGTRLSQVVEINKAPVSFAGFEWDYAGYITGWRGGTLEATHPLRVKFLGYVAPEKPYLPEDYAALIGDKEYSSDLPQAQAVNLQLSSMTILFGE